jgi:hypothetical protein
MTTIYSIVNLKRARKFSGETARFENCNLIAMTANSV